MTELRGSLKALGLERVLDFIADIQATGRLRITDHSSAGEIVLQQGRIVGATFQHERGLDALSAIALALSEADFELLPADTRVELNIALAPDELRSHLAGVARERAELMAACPTLSAVPRRTDTPRSPEVSNQLVFDGDMVRVLLAVDDKRSISTLTGELGLHRTLRALSRLVASGLITLDARGDEEPKAEPSAGADTRAPAPPHHDAGLARRLIGLFVTQEPSPDAPARPQLISSERVDPPRMDPLTRARVLAAGGAFARLGRVAYSHRWAIVVVGLMFLAAGGAYGSGVADTLKTGGYTDPASESSVADEALRRQLGHEQSTVVALFTSTDDLSVDEPDYRAAVEATLARVAEVPGVGHIDTYYSTGSEHFVSADRRQTYATIGLEGDDSSQLDHVRALRPVLTSERLQVRLGGWPAISDELTGQVTRDLEKAELTTFPLVAVLLLLIFGSVVAAGLPLAVGGTAILGSFFFLRVIAGWTDVSLLALNIVTMFGLGLAIDYSLLVVSRFREEMARSAGDVQVAVLRTMRTAGRTVLFSGLTVVISLLSLVVFAPMFLRSLGFGGAIAVLMAMLAALTVLPATLAILGSHVDVLSVRSFRRRRPGRNGARSEGFWQRTSAFVMRRPGTVLLLGLVPLLWIGLPFLRIKFALPDANSLPTHHESRQVADILQRDFPPNESQPIFILVRSAGSALEPANLDALYDYTRQVAALPNVRRVDDLVTVDPRLDKSGYAAFYSAAGRAENPLSAEAASRFAHDNYSLMSVVYDGDPYSAEVQNLVKDIRHLTPPPGLNAQVTGWPTYLLDLLSSLGHSLPLAIALIVGVMFVLLFLMLGSLVVPLKAVILNVLSLSVSFGTLVWVFQEGHLASWLGFTPLGNVDTTQPVIIFASAFGLSMDYEVFLLSRIKEQYDRTGDMWSAVSAGIQKTGAIITSAALLLVVVFLSFMQGEVLFIKEVGLGLAVAILVDATVVRMLLVPATMRLLGAYNWWAPAPLVALHRRLGLGDHELEETPGEDEPEHSRERVTPELRVAEMSATSS